MTARQPGLALILAAAWLLAGLVSGVPIARGAEYTMVTTARYAVDPAAGEIAVEVGVTFENTTPNPSGQFSVFETVELAVQEGAEQVTANDGGGELEVAVTDGDGFETVAITPREEVRFNEVAKFTVHYLLPDGANPDVRVRPSVTTFPAWGFGTSGQVAIVLPPDVEVRVDGSELTPIQETSRMVLRSGEIADPTVWLAVVTASQPTNTTTLDAAVPLASATVDLRVRAWSDDAAWAERTLSLVREALPILEAQMGLDFPRVGALLIAESLPGAADGGIGETPGGSGEVAVAYDAPPFTILHQVAHVWLDDRLVDERWIAEGFASGVAASAAAELEVDLPFDVAARAAELEEAAFPLVSWGVGEASAEQEAWAYAASWDLAAQLTERVGSDAVRQAWRRIADGVNPYAPVGDGPATVPGVGAPAADSRRLLDQLEAVSGTELADLFAARVFDAAAAAQLEARAEARAAFASLLAAAADWGAPEPIRNHMAGWRFGEAAAAIGEAIDWLADRDTLLAAVEDAGLALPQRLRDRYATDGGGPEAREELAAEAAIVAAYVSVLREQEADPSFFERVGGLGGRDPSLLLADARTQFSQGDLAGAAASVEAARAALASAEADGIVRLASVAAVLVVIVAVAITLIRRRRGSGYTAAP